MEGATKKITLAEALGLRKVLAAKIELLSRINVRELFETKTIRKQVSENIDDVTLNIPKLKPEEVTRSLDWHARALRLLDNQIQKANHTTEIDIEVDFDKPYETPFQKS